jgi:hypothetical protein
MMEARPSFVLGVTGQMDLFKLPQVQQDAIRKAVEAVFRYLTTEDTIDVLGPGLKLQATKVTVLSSLAPGAGTLVADLAEAKEFRLVAPLPFPPDLYLRATTFASLTAEQRKQVADRLLALDDRAFYVAILQDARYKGVSLAHPPKSARTAHRERTVTTFGSLYPSPRALPRRTRQPQPSDPLHHRRERNCLQVEVAKS